MLYSVHDHDEYVFRDHDIWNLFAYRYFYLYDISLLQRRPPWHNVHSEHMPPQCARPCVIAVIRGGIYIFYASRSHVDLRKFNSRVAFETGTHVLQINTELRTVGDGKDLHTVVYKHTYIWCTGVSQSYQICPLPTWAAAALSSRSNPLWNASWLDRGPLQNFCTPQKRLNLTVITTYEYKVIYPHSVREWQNEVTKTKIWSFRDMKQWSSPWSSYWQWWKRWSADLSQDPSIWSR